MIQLIFASCLHASSYIFVEMESRVRYWGGKDGSPMGMPASCL
jgi:hypothetical protein